MVLKALKTKPSGAFSSIILQKFEYRFGCKIIKPNVPGGLIFSVLAPFAAIILKIAFVVLQFDQWKPQEAVHLRTPEHTLEELLQDDANSELNIPVAQILPQNVSDPSSITNTEDNIRNVHLPVRNVGNTARKESIETTTDQHQEMDGMKTMSLDVPLHGFPTILTHTPKQQDTLMDTFENLTDAITANSNVLKSSEVPNSEQVDNKSQRMYSVKVECHNYKAVNSKNNSLNLKSIFDNSDSGEGHGEKEKEFSFHVSKKSLLSVISQIFRIHTENVEINFLQEVDTRKVLKTITTRDFNQVELEEFLSDTETMAQKVTCQINVGAKQHSAGEMTDNFDNDDNSDDSNNAHVKHSTESKSKSKDGTSERQVKMTVNIPRQYLTRSPTPRSVFNDDQPTMSNKQSRTYGPNLTNLEHSSSSDDHEMLGMPEEVVEERPSIRKQHEPVTRKRKRKKYRRVDYMQKKKEKLHHHKDKQRRSVADDEEEDEMENIWIRENFVLSKRERGKGSIAKHVRPHVFRKRKKKARFKPRKSRVRFDLAVEEIVPDAAGAQCGYSSGGEQEFTDGETEEAVLENKAATDVEDLHNNEDDDDDNSRTNDDISDAMNKMDIGKDNYECTEEDREREKDKNRIPAKEISYWLRTKEDIESKIDRWKATFTSSDSNSQINEKETKKKPSEKKTKKLKKKRKH